MRNLAKKRTGVLTVLIGLATACLVVGQSAYADTTTAADTTVTTTDTTTTDTTTTTTSWPSGCNGTEVLDYTQGMTAIKHFYHCVSGGKNVTSGNIIQCVYLYCGHYPPTLTASEMSAADAGTPTTVGDSEETVPDSGGPVCTVADNSYKFCYDGPGNPWVITAIAWRDPTCARGWCWHGSGRFAPNEANPVLSWFSSMWSHTVVRRCTAAAVGVIAGAGITIVTDGAGSTIGYAIIGGSSAGCITGALNYYWHD